MSHAHLFSELTAITNNLDLFIPLGVLYLYGRPPMPSKGLEAPDGWSWLELPYQGDLELRPGTGMSTIMHDLRYLNSRGHVRMTYKPLKSEVSVIRLYVLTQDVIGSQVVQKFRSLYARGGRADSWHAKTYKAVMLNLIKVLDYDEEAWSLATDFQLLKYLKSHSILLFPLMSQFRAYNLSNIGKMCLDEPFEHHLKRMINRSSYMRCREEPKKETIEDRLIRIYSQVNSPNFDLEELDPVSRETISEILNGKIPGMKSDLYNYQRRSLAKMYEKEVSIKSVPVPNLIVLSRGSKSFYLDMQTLNFMENATCYHTPRGGILAEDMGLGKTCICLALVCLSKYQISEIPRENRTRASHKHMLSLLDICAKHINEHSIEWKQFYHELPRACVQKLEANLGCFEISQFKVPNYVTRTSRDVVTETRKLFVTSSSLIVVPDNLFHQWKIEIRKHVQENYLKILELQGQAELPQSVAELISNDIVLISLNYFSRQSEKPDSILRSIYWKRLIIDEGHSMNSRSTRAVLLAKQLAVERKWTITGTPTLGLTNLHVEETEEDYTIKRKFNARDDLVKLGTVVSNYLKVEPWSTNPKLWLNNVVKPFENNSLNGDHQLMQILQNLLVRHSVKDVEFDIKLPKLTHQPVFLKPSFFDKLSINLFIAVLATNAVTSERTDRDYMFHPSNKSILRRLINNLQKATFYWTGFSIQDIENLLSICNYALNTIKNRYSKEDVKLLQSSIYTAKVALSNSRWRTNCSVHEMSYFVSNLPLMFHKNMSVANYEYEVDDFHNPIGVYGYPQLHSVQKLFYKNRLVKESLLFERILEESSKEFWVKYWRSNDSKESWKRGPSRVSNQDSIDLDSVRLINHEPKWKNEFDPAKEELEITAKPQKRTTRHHFESLNQSPRKKIKYIPEGCNTPRTPEPLIPEGNFASHLRHARILGTASVKLSYLTSRLLENQTLGIKSIVFYEFENSAYYLTELLDLLGMNYLMYSTYVKIAERSNNLTKFDLWDTSVSGGIVLVMDVKLASHGLTIISATNVFFINPIWNKTVEAQAIKRSHRIGQTREVYVETLILDNTIEKEMYLKRSQTKADETKELIDNTGMQEYIMRFEFLKLFEDFHAEYEPIRSPTRYKMDLGVQKDDFDDGLKLFGVESTIQNGMRTWKLPLFTEQSLARTTENESKVKDEPIDIFKTDFEMQKENSSSCKLLQKLKGQRKTVRFG
ncbi:hypothetical protein KL930_002714 [Ogataea haglerorum]|nr:hypothetical protein KL930_002714 [Ogataea haglerorum]KAG7779313.1 hypothetical protein KL922_001798 [Ogataea haglerorum]